MDELEHRMRQFAEDIKVMPDSYSSQTRSALIRRAIDEADWLESWRDQTSKIIAMAACMKLHEEISDETLPKSEPPVIEGTKEME